MITKWTQLLHAAAAKSIQIVIELSDIYAQVKPCSERPTKLNSTGWVESGRALWILFTTRLNSTQLVCELLQFWTFSVELSCQSVQSARLDSTQLNRMSFSCDPVFIWPHNVNTVNCDVKLSTSSSISFTYLLQFMTPGAVNPNTLTPSPEIIFCLRHCITLYNDNSVSLTKKRWPMPVARYRRVTASLSAGVMAAPKFVLVRWSTGVILSTRS